ncbi:hypothetical protein F4009_06305 [Candidatus Poribacteria bacterium]|nr:hypothetical protein [Candidatus Poribacteria bacterium]MYH83383.1 hypothetical protein [Candidatus Poribacteria bacterium]MYK93602.1 hypothetical protein [Candidatus Poribacteria bacterium]
MGASDTNVRVDLTAKIEKIVEDTQELYADEMERNGFERKTFRVETRLGKPRVHIVNGKRSSAHYIHNTFEKVRPELPNFLNQDTEPWDKQDMIVVIIVGGIACLDAADGWCGWGTGFPFHSLRYGGGVVIAANSGHFNKEVLFHEIGHAFGLYHKPAGAEDGVLDLYEARWLDKHYQFNRRGNDFTLPQFVGVHKMTALENDKVRFEVDVTSNHGLHQAIIVGADILVVASDFMDGKNRDTTTFEFDRHLAANNMFVELMDTRGNYVSRDFAIRLPARLPTKPEEPNPALLNVNVLMYTGAVSWMSLDDANRQSQITKQLLSSKGIRAEIVQTEDAVRDWMLQTTSDGNVDVLILYGVLPTSIHPYPNSQPDGSVAEIWIESTDGNTILNHGDYFGYVDNNGVQTLQDIMDIPHITMWDFGLENNTPMVVTKDGKEVTPSLTNFQSDRAFHLDELTGDWFAEKVLASNTGTSQATRADPVIVRDGDRGRIGIVYQTFNEVNPKGKVVAELIANFLLRNNNEISSPLLEPITDNDTGNRSDTVSLLPASVQSPNIGQQLKLFLKITNGENVAGYQTTVQFDDTALRFVSGKNGDFLPAGAYFVEPKMEGNLVQLNAVSFTDEVSGDGILATLTFEVIAMKASTLTLSDVLFSNSTGETFAPQVENAEITEPTKLKGDVNGDGTVNIADLVLVASNLGETGQNVADVNGDGQVNIADLVLVAGALGNSAAAPSLNPQALKMLAATEVKQWLSAAQRLNLTDTTSQRGILFLQQLLTVLIPRETALLPNFPNPFNPETWIPYRLAKDAEVTLHIYAVNGTLVRTLVLGYQPAGLYQSRSRAAYWDGKNEFGESVASSVYFYKLTTDGFTATRKMLILK